jgi:hypothetical protein
MPFRPRYTGLINKYRDRLPLPDDARTVSLGEGNTPLIRLNTLPAEMGRDIQLYEKGTSMCVCRRCTSVAGTITSPAVRFKAIAA